MSVEAVDLVVEGREGLLLDGLHGDLVPAAAQLREGRYHIWVAGVAPRDDRGSIAPSGPDRAPIGPPLHQAGIA